MYETMDAAPGVGLAAPQVGVGLRLFVYDWVDDDGTHWRGVAINPELWISPPPVGEPDDDEESEGCLSFPGERFAAATRRRAILRATDLDRQPVRDRRRGLARAHLPARVRPPRRRALRRPPRRTRSEARARRSAASSAGAARACVDARASTTSRTDRPRTGSGVPMCGCRRAPASAELGHPLS